MKRRALYFTAPQALELREEELGPPDSGRVRVETACSAISAGTELLLYRGEAPQAAAADESLAALPGSLAYPLKYGYSAVGRVAQLGQGVAEEWQGQRVFAFNPHESAFHSRPEDLQPIPETVADEDAVFLANMETAINLILDGNPRLGESVAVLGQGVVGLLATALLARHPLAQLMAFDHHLARRQWALDLGADQGFEPSQFQAAFSALGERRADLVFELSGQPEALNLALGLVGAEGRIVVGSWYGQRRAELQLDERFHRGRVQIISSQVGRIPPALSGRWDRARRFALAWEMLAAIRPSRMISQRLPLDQAAEAYRLLAEQPDQALGVVFNYP